ncbi:hypothetical protein IV505_18105 [Pseudomonas fulva]|nr:hypothetical protein [Pseudomonas fulva]MBF8781625.1 hypothetical protein [Pseudomonas fulva]
MRQPFHGRDSGPVTVRPKPCLKLAEAPWKAGFADEYQCDITLPIDYDTFYEVNTLAGALRTVIAAIILTEKSVKLFDHSIEKRLYASWSMEAK